MVTQLNNALVAVGCDGVAVAERDWIVRQDTVVRPDVMVICGDPPEGHQLAPPAKIVEVLSPSTRANDLGYKKDLYHEQGVTHYWVADLIAQTVAAFDMTSPGGESTPLGGITRFTLGDNCQIEIDPAEIWPTRKSSNSERPLAEGCNDSGR
ncbi:hypothetical protein Pla52n_48350 [Stieleria varia]|uniref:Putative restriction endonuclease domain-containing protein n=1 Tax=Stieleria varia TaxID=2528005 RepID=A0A5C6AJB4_9BACT|nr:hypothetical protein Pla52n_48350 [Stieleria varia]